VGFSFTSIAPFTRFPHPTRFHSSSRSHGFALDRWTTHLDDLDVVCGFHAVVHGSSSSPFRTELTPTACETLENVEGDPRIREEQVNEQALEACVSSSPFTLSTRTHEVSIGALEGIVKDGRFDFTTFEDVLSQDLRASFFDLQFRRTRERRASSTDDREPDQGYDLH
jgi:hypothetical protein